MEQMKKIIALSILVLTLMTIHSCKKDIPESDMDFVGIWYGDYTELEIIENGSGNYDYDDGFVTKYIHGKVKIKNNILKFKALVFSKKYTIDQRPVTDSYGTYMILDDETFTKY